MTSALWGPPRNMRLVALDVETCVGPDQKHRVIALGLAICRGGGLRQRFSWLVNPGVPIDPYTAKVHHLEDEDVAAEPSFADVLPQLILHVTPRAHETVVLAAHNARFDIPVIRGEIARCGGTELPDLAVIDTMGPLAKVAGVSVAGGKLSDLLEALDITNPAPHDALGDAQALALAVCALLERADDAGHSDLDALLTALDAPSVEALKVVTGSAKIVELAVPLPPEHVATHAEAMSEDPSAAELARWQQMVDECAEMRCPALAGRVGAMPVERFRALLFQTLRKRVEAGDAAGTATALGALMAALDPPPASVAELRAEGAPVSGVPGQGAARGTAIALYVWLEQLLAPIGRCEDDDSCPSCRDGAPCPRDVWAQAIATAIVKPEEASVEAYWNPRGGLMPAPGVKSTGRGYVAVRNAAPRLADFGLRVCLRYLRDAGQSNLAAQVADGAWRQGGSRDPLVAELRARAIARAGREADLRAALEVCYEALGTIGGSTDPAWRSLAMRTAQLEGALERMLTPEAKAHRSLNPKRPPRKPRFLRA